MYKKGDKVCIILDGKLVEGTIGLTNSYKFIGDFEIYVDDGCAMSIYDKSEKDVIPSPIAKIEEWLAEINSRGIINMGEVRQLERVLKLLKGETK